MAISSPIALVTGAAHRLGKAFALTLARRGYAIMLHYHSSDEAAQVAADEVRALGMPVYPWRADLTSEVEVAGLFQELASLGHPLRILVNSAGLMQHADARAISASEIDAVFDLNLRAPFLLSSQAYQSMADGGLIVNMSDIASEKNWTGFPAYTVSKAGLDALTRVLARSFAPRVRVNAIAPGLVLPSENMSTEEWTRLVNRLPAGRAAQLDEITRTLEFLLDNEYITGQVISVDGGYSLL